jgi:hypothetical protein
VIASLHNIYTPLERTLSDPGDVIVTPLRHSVTDARVRRPGMLKTNETIARPGGLRSETMGVLDKLRKVGNYIRKGWSSTGPDSYFRYRRDHDSQRKQSAREHENVDRSAALEREEAQRGREYEDRYAAEHAAEEPQSEAPRNDTSKPE